MCHNLRVELHRRVCLQLLSVESSGKQGITVRHRPVSEDYLIS